MSQIADELASIRRNTGRMDAMRRAFESAWDVAADKLLDLTGLPAEVREERAAEVQALAKLEALAPATPYQRKRPLWAWNRRQRGGPY